MSIRAVRSLISASFVTVRVKFHRINQSLKIQSVPIRVIRGSKLRATLCSLWCIKKAAEDTFRTSGRRLKQNNRCYSVIFKFVSF